MGETEPEQQLAQGHSRGRKSAREAGQGLRSCLGGAACAEPLPSHDPRGLPGLEIPRTLPAPKTKKSGAPLRA